jgi:predicted lipoprotein with Yx(FWY)xxD motif
MKRSIGFATMVTSVAMGLVACGGGDDGAAAPVAGAEQRSAARETNGPEATHSGRGRTVKVAKSQYGRLLVDGRGHTLYLFTRDAGKSRSRCYGACAKAWPPFYTNGSPRAGRGAKSGLLGTTVRRNGKRQVTYNGHPLYYYVSEDQPGEILCQNVEEFGGVWLVTAPTGKAIR